MNKKTPTQKYTQQQHNNTDADMAESSRQGTFQDKAKPALVRESNIMAAKGEFWCVCVRVFVERARERPEKKGLCGWQRAHVHMLSANEGDTCGVFTLTPATHIVLLPHSV